MDESCKKILTDIVAAMTTQLAAWDQAASESGPEDVECKKRDFEEKGEFITDIAKKVGQVMRNASVGMKSILLADAKKVFWAMHERVLKIIPVAKLIVGPTLDELQAASAKDCREALNSWNW